MSRAEYDAINAANASLLKRMLVSARSGKHYLDYGYPDTPALLEGRLFDLMVFDLDEYHDQVAVAELDMRTKVGKAWKAEQEELGRTIIKPDLDDKIRAMHRSISQHPLANGLLFGDCDWRFTQLQMQWTDERTGMECKGVPDMVVRIDGETWLVDVKTTSNLFPRRFSTDCATFGYDVQMAFYRDGLHAKASPLPVDRVAFIAVGKDAVHDVIVYEVDEETFLYHGREKYHQALQLLKRCRETDRWPGFAEDDVVSLHLPEFAHVDVELTMDGAEVSA